MCTGHNSSDLFTCVRHCTVVLLVIHSAVMHAVAMHQATDGDEKLAHYIVGIVS